jgi:hypothetical protein
MVAHRSRDTDAARFSQHFEPRRHVDAITEDIVFLDDHVTQIDANAELNPPRRRDVHVAAGHPALNFGRAQHRIGDTGELDQHAVTRCLDDTTAILRNAGINKLDPMGLETRERARLVGLHQPAIADHVSSEHRCKPAFRIRHSPLLRGAV